MKRTSVKMCCDGLRSAKKQSTQVLSSHGHVQSRLLLIMSYLCASVCCLFSVSQPTDSYFHNTAVIKVFQIH
jgi:hypothetical protein